MVVSGFIAFENFTRFTSVGGMSILKISSAKILHSTVEQLQVILTLLQNVH